MKTFAEIFNRKTKLLRLDEHYDQNFDSFETATREIIKSFKENLKTYSLRYDDLDIQIAHTYSKIESYETEEQFNRIDEQLHCESQSEYIDEYLNSLVEMKVVYLFKSLELTIKHLIKTAYPDIDIKSLYKWENIKEFFKSRKIDIVKLNGYLECVEVKKINNCIKHNGIVSDEIKSIPEFSEQSYLKHEQLEMFHQRVYQRVRIFCDALREKIKEDLYVFTDERLNQIAEDFYERMDDSTIERLIEKLKSKLQKQPIIKSHN